MMDTYDLVVIGAGPAGQAAAELAAHVGRRAIIVEQNRPGGVVTTTGGAPTKTLREAARYLTGFGEAEVYGVRPSIPLEVALPIVVARTQQVRDRLQSIVARRLAGLGIDYLQGAARLRPDGVVLVTLPDGSERELRGRAVLVATGSRPAHPPGIPFDDPDVFDTDRIFTLDRLPTHAVIVGGGPVGIEFATVFAALGVPVTVVSEAERLLPSMDAELTELLADDLSSEGVRLVLGTGAERVGRVDGRLTVTLSTGEALETDIVLFAAGRTPNSEGLGLDEVGVQLDGRGRIVVDRYFRTTAPGVYAAGDVVRPALASTAMQQGRAAASHACGLLFGMAVDQAGQLGGLRAAGGGRGRPDRGAGAPGRDPVRRRALRPGGDGARHHRRARRPPEADLPGGRPQAPRRALHRRHRLGDDRPGTRRHRDGRHDRAAPDAGPEHADLQRGLSRRRHRRPVTPGRGAGPRPRSGCRRPGSRGDGMMAVRHERSRIDPRSVTASASMATSTRTGRPGSTT